MAVRRAALAGKPTKAALSGPKRVPAKKKKPAAKNKVSAGASAMPMPVNREETVSIRKISNGYLVRKTSYAGDNYKETEKFVARKPKLSI